MSNDSRLNMSFGFEPFIILRSKDRIFVEMLTWYLIYIYLSYLQKRDKFVQYFLIGLNHGVD